MTLVTLLFYTLISSLVTLFPVMNPIGNGLIVNGYLAGLGEEERLAAIKKISRNALFLGMCTLVLGHLVLMLFGLAVPVIQLGGGLVICKSALEWLSDDNRHTRLKKASVDREVAEAEAIDSKLFYPITFPMCFGPGSISVVLALMATAEAKSANIWYIGLHYLIIALAIFLLVKILYVFLKQSPRLTKKLGTSGNMIINKLLSFFMLCIGLQIVVQGISSIFGLSITL